MPGIEDWVNKPLDILQNIFDNSSPRECHKKVTEYFTKVLQNATALAKVPSVNDSPLHNLKSGSLVRFRCMIQDMFDPEFFLGAYEVIHMPSQRRYMKLGMYKDIADCQKMEEVDMDSPRNATMDRLTYYCISVPGENDWVQKGYSKLQPTPTQPTTSTVPSRQKRSLDASEDGNQKEPMTTNTHEENAESKRTRIAEAISNSETAASAVSTSPDMNFPLPNTDGTACLVKLYDQSTSLKVNDVIEVVGVLSTDPRLASVCPCSDSDSDAVMTERIEEMDVEHSSHNPPPSLVPRIHVVMAKKLDHNNPNLPWSLSESQNKHVVDEMLNQASKIRNELHAILSQALLGDTLAAEYLLCHLISGIYIRRDVVALGKFSLNLCKVPLHDDYNAHLYNLMQQIVTKSCYIPLSLENLNTYNFTPKKDYGKNRLISGILQLPVHTHMVLDETALSIGRLETKGVQNVTALGNLITWQRVDYDFSFHRLEYSTDVAALVLSEGKSLLPNDCRVPLHPVGSCGTLSSIFEAIQTYLTESLLQQIRCYLTILKLIDYNMSETLQKLVQEDFVSMRRQDSAFNADDLHSLLVLARFLSLSIGERSLSRESWEKAKSLEAARKQRLQASI